MLIAATSLLAVSVQSHAANWVSIGGNGTTEAFIDKQSLRRTGQKVKVWSKWEYSEPMEVRASYSKKTYLASKELDIYDCSERTSLTTQQTLYGTPDMDSVVGSFSSPDFPHLYSEVVPDSIGEAILEFACKETAHTKRS